MKNKGAEKPKRTKYKQSERRGVVHRKACRKWMAKNRDYERARKREWYQKEKAKLRAKYLLLMETDAAYRKRVSARTAAQYHIKMSKCERCGSKENLVRHHHDYNKPLEVEILCGVCHGKAHRKE